MKPIRLKPSVCLLFTGLGTLAMPAKAEVIDGNKGELVERAAKEQQLRVIEGPKGHLGLEPEARPQAPIAGREGGPDIPKELICAVPPPPKAINPAFEVALYQQLRNTEGNVFFSPYSVSEAMGMVYVGAAANTAKEISEALHFGQQGSFGDRMQYLRHHVLSNANQNGDKLKIANALCVTGKAPDVAYQNQIRQLFDAEFFGGGLDEINAWVKQQTEGKIEKILEQLSPNTACVLLNAVYFKGDWQQPFKASKTREGDFHVSADKQVKVKFMSQRKRFKYTRGPEWIAVELPYKSGCSMVLMMPSKADGMAALEAGLDEAKLAQVYQKLQQNRHGPLEEQIELVMPKFKIATSYDLIPSFKQVGVSEAFTQNANFSKMYGDNSVYITQIKHKATLEVDELGSVASAATAVEMTRKSMPMPAPEMRFDRPFIVTIKENVTDSTLFIGRISDPTAE